MIPQNKMIGVDNSSPYPRADKKEFVDSKIELSAESKYSTKEVQKMWALNNE